MAGTADTSASRRTGLVPRADMFLDPRFGTSAVASDPQPRTAKHSTEESTRYGLRRYRCRAGEETRIVAGVAPVVGRIEFSARQYDETMIVRFLSGTMNSLSSS